MAGSLLLVAVPASFAGLGPAEAGATGIFLGMGYALPVAIAAGALPYLLRLVGALEGAAWEVVEGGSTTMSATRQLISERRSS